MRTSRRNGMPGIEEFVRFLQDRSLKATPQRIAVHKAMLTLEHASADMIKSCIDAAGEVKITLASVYNTLTQLAQKGIYTQLPSSDGKVCYDICNAPHAHLYDTRNHEFINIVDGELRDIIDRHFKRRKFKGYSVDSIDIRVNCHPTKKHRIK